MSKPLAARSLAFRVKRERVLQAGASCFNNKGYSGTSLKDVSAQLGLTDAALYYYVKNKEQLVYECYLRAAEIGWRCLQQARTEGGSGLQQIERYLQLHIGAHCGDEGPIAIMSEIPSLTATHREDILERSRRHSLAFEDLLQLGVDDNSISACDIRMTGNAIMGAMNWIPKWYHGDQELAPRVLEEFSRYLCRGLAARE